MIFTLASLIVVFGFGCILVGLHRHTRAPTHASIRYAVRGVIWMMVGAVLLVIEAARLAVLSFFGA